MIWISRALLKRDVFLRGWMLLHSLNWLRVAVYSSWNQGSIEECVASRQFRWRRISMLSRGSTCDHRGSAKASGRIVIQNVESNCSASCTPHVHSGAKPRAISCEKNSVSSAACCYVRTSRTHSQVWNRSCFRYWRNAERTLRWHRRKDDTQHA